MQSRTVSKFLCIPPPVIGYFLNLAEIEFKLPVNPNSIVTVKFSPHFHQKIPQVMNKVNMPEEEQV